MNKSKHIRNELVIKGTRIGVWDWNIQTGETYFNERWAEIVGHTLAELEPVSIDTWMKFAHPEDLEESNNRLQAHFAGEEEYYDFESRMKHKDGHWVWVHDRGKVFEWDETGAPLRMCGSHIEITEQKQLEINLKESIKDRDILLKEVHHRVKNNLQLLLSLSRLKDKNGFIETKEIEESINSIARAYEAIYKTDGINKISVQQYIQKIIDPIVRTQNIKLSSEVDELHKPIDFLIPIGLIITELLNNSSKHAFSSSTKNSVTISLLNEGGLLKLRYNDNGAGYPEKVLNGIQNSDSFGIMIMKGLIGQLDGTIRFFNESGACTEIIIPE
ncbi:MAG: sensor histidine kinase [Crocinitomicaceae bacterium]